MGGGSGTRLYYRSVKFMPADNARVAEKLTSGFTKSIKFISTDFNQCPNLVNPGSSLVQYQITTSVVHPLRVWLLSYPVIDGTNTGTPFTTPFTGLQCLQRPWYAPGVILGFFNQDNIQVNNINYFRQNLQTIQDHWEYLHEQFNVRDHDTNTYMLVCFLKLLLTCSVCV